MSSVLKAFNNHLLEFIDDVIRIFPNNLDIKTGKTFIEGVKKVNPKKIITYWRDNILALYEKEILEEDITFFKQEFDENTANKENEFNQALLEHFSDELEMKNTFGDCKLNIILLV